MRVTLADATLARHAGRFVWLDLDFDKPQNQAFLARHEVAWTPAFFVVDPADERAAATHFGAMTRAELERFLDEGERDVRRKGTAAIAHGGPADAALARGDELVGRGQLAEAEASYREALRVAPAAWPNRNRAVYALVETLQVARDARGCGETAAALAPSMARDHAFAGVVTAGLSCVEGTEPWAARPRQVLEPLASAALAVPDVLRDDRFQIYQSLMDGARARHDRPTLERWGKRWLDEIDATHPASDDERAGLDVARVDAVKLLDDPARALPALAASERAMPTSYTASARYAAVAEAAGRPDDALAAVERGLAHVDGAIGRAGLYLTKARALLRKHDVAGARTALAASMTAARAIGNPRIRDNFVRRVDEELAKTSK